MQHLSIKVATSMLAALVSFAALAQQVAVTEPAIRSTVEGQKVTGAFFAVTSDVPAKLVGVSSPIAGAAELHEMTMKDGRMIMRSVAFINLPAGQRVELKPGGLHVMLMNLTRTIKAGERVPLTLHVTSADGRQVKIEVQAPAQAPGAPR